jgi:Cdc6-like AAA superfamily ATPase
MRTAKENLIRMFTDKTSKLRDLIVRLDSPVFSKSSVDVMTTTTLPWQTPRRCKELDIHYERLNEDQRRAVLRAFCAKDYALIRGMPGTGKTLTVSFLIRASVRIASCGV